MLQWARAQQCPWDERTCNLAAGNGHLELMKWAIEHHVPGKRCVHMCVCAFTVENAHLETLESARAQQSPWVK